MQLSDKDGVPQLAYVGYSTGTFRLYRMPVKAPIETVQVEQASGAPETLAYKPELNLALDDSEKKKYKRKWSVDAPSIALGVANDGTVFTDSTIIFSDLLGDYRIFLRLNSIASYSNLNVLYLDLKKRLQWGANVFDFRDYYLAAFSDGALRTRQATRQTGAFAYAQYPLNRHYRLEGQAGYLSRSITLPFLDQQTGFIDFVSLGDSFAVSSLGMVSASSQAQVNIDWTPPSTAASAW